MSHNIIRDPRYGFLRLDPIPAQAEVDQLYLSEFYSQNASYFNNSALNVQLEQSEYQRSRWQRILDVFSELSFESKGGEKSVFDIGFGFAQALLFFREHGFSVSGLEPSPEGVAYASEQGVNVFHAGIDDLNSLDTNHSDLVLLLNVLEHLRDPASTLIGIREKLMHENSVLMIEVPNDFNDFQTTANAAFNLDEWWVLAPNHINYFSHTSLTNLLNDCGYRVLKKEASFPLEMFLLFGDVYVGDGDIGKSCHEKRVQFEMLLRKHGKLDKLDSFYSALANLDLGRTAIAYAMPA